MAKQDPTTRPPSKELAPDPATSYERAKPYKEAGMGRLDNDIATPQNVPDQVDQAVTNVQPLRQINAHDVVNGRAAHPADGASVNPGSGKEPRRRKRKR